MVFTPNNYLLYHAASSEIVGRVLICSSWVHYARARLGPAASAAREDHHIISMIGWCASAAVGSEPPEDFSPRCCSSPSSYLFYFSSSNATRNCHLFAFICTRPRRHGYIDNLTSVADTCRPAAAVLSANQLIYNIQSSSAAAAAVNARISSSTTNDQESWRRVAHFNCCLRRSNNTIERSCLGTITTKQTWLNMELWRNEMEEEIDRIISIESFPTLHPLCVRKGGGDIIQVWIQSDRSLQSWTTQLAECCSTIFELALQK